MLVDMGYESSLLEPLINRAFEEHSDLAVRDLMPIILNWYQNKESGVSVSAKPKKKTVKKNEWHTLESRDLRFLFSQSANEEDFQKSLSKENIVLDAEHWVDLMR